VGAVTPLGIGVNAFWDGMTAGRSGIRRIEHFDASDLDVKIAGEVPGFDPKEFIDGKMVRRMDRFAQFAVAASREAIADAGLEITDENRERVGVMMNTGGGGIPTIAHDVRVMEHQGPRRVSSLLIPLFAPNMASCQVAIAFGVHGPTVTSVAACAAGVQAFVDAVHLIERGDADVVITGGTEAGIIPVAIAGLSNMRALSKRNDEPEKASRPFDADRDGFVFSEGAAVAILESEEHAAKRGANAIAYAHGGTSTSHAFHITAPDPTGRGATAAMTGAMKRAGVDPNDVDYNAAHATSTNIGDIAETNAIKNAFGDHAYEVSISANKSMLGHLLGAAGSVETIATVLSVRDGVVPITRNLDDLDDGVQLDVVAVEPRRLPVPVAVNNAFGFGGHNVALVVRKV
jgi:3-oxoacyl-[acyl-carrier-protein] synthase II